MLALMALAACGSGDRLPDNVLPPERMAPVLKQMIAADEWVNWRVEQQQPIDANAERIHRYRAALRAAGISEEQFRTSFAYYKAHPKMLGLIFDTLQRQPIIDTVAAPMGAPRKPGPALQPAG